MTDWDKFKAARRRWLTHVHEQHVRAVAASKWWGNKIHKVLLCPLGKHSDVMPSGKKGNFCGACRKQTNSNAFKDFDVHLVGGDVKQVKAVSEKHAGSLVIFEGQEFKCNAQTGEAIGPFTVHPANILRVDRVIPRATNKSYENQ